MAINPDAVGSKSDPVEISWDSKDSLLYALGVGAGLDELQFTTENSQDIDQQVLPTQAVILQGFGNVFEHLGSFNPAMLVHGEQSIELEGAIPVAGTASCVAELTGIYDKGKGAVVAITGTTTDAATGNKLFSQTASLFIRGEGGWGGDRGPSGPKNVAPDRAPDHSITYETREDQALLYRLSGDRNPLHSDPKFAELAGFPKPILHGLCTYGFTGRALLHTLCDSDPARFKSMEGRFSKPVMPGDDLRISMWVDGNECRFQTRNQDDAVVFDQGVMTFA